MSEPIKESLKVGFVGSGFIAHFHARALTQLRGMDVVGAYSPNGCESFVGYCREHGLGNTKEYKSITELAENVDTLLLCIPNFVRIPVMEEIADARKKGARVWSIICDKPLGRNLAEADRIVELTREAQLLTSYFENQVHMGAVQTQRQQLETVQREMGPLMLTRSAEEHGGPHEPWFWDPTQQGGGVLSDMGCHSISVGWYMLNPLGKPVDFLEPQSISCDLGLLKWGQPKWRDKLLKERGVDYKKTPAEDFATGTVTFKNPETGQLSKAQFTDSWMFEKQGLRLLMDGMGPGYAFEINTLVSPLTLFIGDAAAEAIQDQESALEKSTSSRGLLAVHPNEADLYGYVQENRDAFESFRRGQDGLLNFEYGRKITRLVMAAYLSHERGKTIDLTDPNTDKELQKYVPAIAQGKGAELLY